MSEGQHAEHRDAPPAGDGAQERSGHGADGGAAGHGAHGGGQECLLCPVCVVLQAVGAARPEVTRHLLAAGRELTLALQALLEEHLRAHDGASPGDDRGLERIDVE